MRINFTWTEEELVEANLQSRRLVGSPRQKGIWLYSTAIAVLGLVCSYAGLLRLYLLINGFVETNPLVVVQATDASDAGTIKNALNNNDIIGIGDDETLMALEKLANDGYDFHGKTIVLTADINMEEYALKVLNKIFCPPTAR